MNLPYYCFHDVDVVDYGNDVLENERRLQALTAYAKETLGRVRGKFSGNLKTPDSELQMDYVSLQTEAKDEKTKLEEELKLRLERLRPEKQMEKEALLAENLNKQMKYRAMPRQIYVI
jgi:hypothetical protein